MSKNKFLKVVCMGCILALLSGCRGKAPQVSSVTEQPSENKQEDVKKESQGYITLEEAKASALENVGLSEENVRFVRVNLDAESSDARYDVEFISKDAEYDCTVDALTGEILSMTCENGSYDIEQIPSEVTQAAEGQDGAENVPSDSGTAAKDQSEAAQQYIGVEAAKKIALDHAGLKADDVRFVHAHLEFDDGYWKYDVEFHKDSTEYDYNIDAQSGEVVSHDYDAEYYQHGADSSSDSGQITRDQAKQIALDHADIAESETKYLNVEFDYDDGRAEYQVEWYVGRMEYSCDVDAGTGAVLSFEKEYD